MSLRLLAIAARLTALAAALSVLPGCALLKRKAVGMVAKIGRAHV